MADKNVINGRYVLETEYTPKVATGVNFVIQGDDVVLSFFCDNPIIPNAFEIIVDENNKTEGANDTANEYVRSIHSRVSIKKKDIVGILRLIADTIEEKEND